MSNMANFFGKRSVNLLLLGNSLIPLSFLPTDNPLLDKSKVACSRNHLDVRLQLKDIMKLMPIAFQGILQISYLMQTDCNFYVILIQRSCFDNICFDWLKIWPWYRVKFFFRLCFLLCSMRNLRDKAPCHNPKFLQAQ